LQGNPQQDAEARKKAQFGSGIGSMMGPVGSVAGGALGAAASVAPTLLSAVPGLQFLAPIAPAALSAMPAMMSAGAGMGGAAGNALGGAFKAGGEEALDPVRERELKKAALMEMLGRYR
jgi:hypothetical protein